MNKELFITIFKDKPLRNFIFEYIRLIHREIIKAKSYKWEQLINEKPSLLAHYSYYFQLKEYYNNHPYYLAHIFFIGTIDVIISKVNCKESFEIFKFVYEKIKNHVYVTDVISSSIRYNRLDIIKYLSTIKDNNINYRHVIHSGFLSIYSKHNNNNENNKLEIVLYILQRVDIIEIDEISLIIRYASEHRIIEPIIDWLLNSNKVNSNDVISTLRDQYVYSGAFQSGNLDVVRCIYEKSGKVLPERMYCPISNENQYEIFLWLHQLYLESPDTDQQNRLTSNSIDYAIKTGSLERVKWLCENRNYDLTTLTIIQAIEYGNLEIIKYIHSLSGPINDGVIIVAHKLASLPVIQWLCDNAESIRWDYAMKESSERGDLELVQWVHQKSLEIDCTPEAMDVAASCGHLEIVKFLHSNRTEGCSSMAMDGAATNGHIETLKWLHHNRTEGCTKGAIDNASQYGHLEVVKWLLENRTEGCTVKAIDYAVMNDDLEMVRFLIEHSYEGYTHTSWKNASQNSNIEILELLKANPEESFIEKKKNALERIGDWQSALTYDFMLTHPEPSKSTPLLTNLLYNTFQYGKFLASSWLLENRSDPIRESDYIEIVKHHDFKTINLICRYRQNSIQIFSDIAIKRNETEVIQWLKKTYNIYFYFDITH